MKLLICTQTVDKNDPILGFFHRWVEEFAKHFDRIDVICLKEGEHELPAHVQVHSLGKEGGENRLKYLWRFYRYFWKLYVRQDVDFVFYHMGAIYNILGKPFFFIRKFKRTKFIWWKTHAHINFFGRVALLFVDRVVTAGSQSFPVNTKKRTIVGHAIDTNKLIERADIPRIHNRIITVGRVAPVKNIQTGLAVIKELKKRGVAVEYRIIGTLDDQTHRTRLDSLIKEFDIEELVTFVGSRTQDEIVTEYNQAAILLHPAVNAGFDKTVLEAMASGTIPLTSIPSYKTILEEYGLYVEPNDIMSYVDQILYIKSLSNSELDSLKTLLRAIVREHHSLDTLPKRIFNIG